MRVVSARTIGRHGSVTDGATGLAARQVLWGAPVVVLALEMARVLFSVGYHMADRVGWIPGGALIAVTFMAPAVYPLWSRLAGRWALPVLVGSVAAVRLAIQGVRPVPYWLAALGVAAVLMVIVFVFERITPLAFAMSVVTALAVDVSIRGLGRTWDVPWRSDMAAWTVAAAVVVWFLVAMRALLVERGLVRPGMGGALRAALLLGPFLYLACFYTQSPAYLASSGRVPLAAAVAVALGDALLAAVGVSLGAGRSLPSRSGAARDWLVRHRWVGAPLLAAGGALLPIVTGHFVVVLAAVVQVVAAVSYGTVVRGGAGTSRTWRTASSLAAGMLLFGLLALLYQVSFLVRLPFPAWAVPAAAGAVFSLTQIRPISPPLAEVRAPMLWRSLAALAVAVPAFLVVSLPALPSQVPAKGPVTVMTFNINQAVRVGQLDLGEIAGLIREVHPDVVVLQEVGRGMAVSGMADEAEWMRWNLNLPYVWAPAGDNQFGNLILTRLRVVDHSVMDLGSGAGTQDRSAAFVRLDTGGGRDLLVIGAHLQNGSAPALHLTRADEYRAILRRWGGQARTVLAGDLNTYPGWPELALLSDAGFHTPQNTQACTMATSNRNCPDWVFVSRDLVVSDVHVTADRPDHRPLVATVTTLGSPGG